MRPCIRCRRPLDPAEGGVIRCPCGLRYAVELVEQADPEVWDAVLRGDGYRIHDEGGDTLWVETVGRPSGAHIATSWVAAGGGLAAGAPTSGIQDLEAAVLAALGLDGQWVRRLTLTFEVDEAPLVEAELVASSALHESGEDLVAALRRYRLVPATGSTVTPTDETEG